MTAPRAFKQQAVREHQALHAMGSVKVWELARLADIGIDQLIVMVVQASGLPAIPDHWPSHRGATTRRSRSRLPGNRSIIAPLGRFNPPKPPVLARMLGRAALREIDAAVDHWVLATVLRDHDWNVTHAAARLGMSRRRLRARWSRVRNLPKPSSQRGAGTLSQILEPPSLPGLLQGGATLQEIRAATREWFVACTAALKEGNRTHAAAALAISRRRVRQFLATSSGAPNPEPRPDDGSSR